MNNEPIAYINVEERKLEWAKPMTWHTPTIAQMDKIPLYIHTVKELTDFEIRGVMALDECWIGEDCSIPNMIAFARAILKKAQDE
jgi:hypothetical protein